MNKIPVIFNDAVLLISYPGFVEYYRQLISYINVLAKETKITPRIVDTAIIRTNELGLESLKAK
jgi:hypothetical protein